MLSLKKCPKFWHVTLYLQQPVKKNLSSLRHNVNKTIQFNSNNFTAIESPKLCVCNSTSTATSKCKQIRFMSSSSMYYGSKENKKSLGFMGWFLLFVPITTFCLGTWQVKRRKWKLELMEALHTKTTAEPVDLPEDLSELPALEYCRVKVRGEFDHSKEMLQGPRSLLLHGDAASQGGLIVPKGSQSSGVLVITPFKLADRDMTILVQRGWVPSNRKDANTRPEGQVTGEVELIGIVRAQEKRAPFVPQNKPASNYWFYRDIESMASLVSAMPVFLDATVESSVPGGPVGGQTRVTLRNEHMSYIMTWYGLSAATSYLWFRHFVQKLPLK